jgi:hypothetical protein
MIGVEFAWFDSDESSMKQQRGKGQLVLSFPSSFLLLLIILKINNQKECANESQSSRDQFGDSIASLFLFVVRRQCYA